MGDTPLSGGLVWGCKGTSLRRASVGDTPLSGGLMWGCEGDRKRYCGLLALVDPVFFCVYAEEE